MTIYFTGNQIFFQNYQVQLGAADHILVLRVWTRVLVPRVRLLTIHKTPEMVATFCVFETMYVVLGSETIAIIIFSV